MRKKIKNLHNETNNTTVDGSTVSSDEQTHSVSVKNLPYGQKDVEDANELIRDGLGLDIEVLDVHRAPSVSNNAGVLTIELSPHDKEQVLKHKRKLRFNEKYYDVYIDSTTTHIQQRIEEKFKLLMNYMHDEGRSSHNRHQYNGHQYNGHQYNGHQYNGHQYNGHQYNGHQYNSQQYHSTARYSSK